MSESVLDHVDVSVEIRALGLLDGSGLRLEIVIILATTGRAVRISRMFPP